MSIIVRVTLYFVPWFLLANVGLVIDIFVMRAGDDFNVAFWTYPPSAQSQPIHDGEDKVKFTPPHLPWPGTAPE